MNSIKERVPTYELLTFDGEIIELQTAVIDKFLDKLNDKSENFIKIGSSIYAKNQIKSVKETKPSNEVDEYIIRLPKGEIRDLLKEITKERKTKSLTTKSINHLLEIAKSRKPHLF